MAKGALRTWNLAQCIVTVGGLPIEGFSEDDAFNFSPDADTYEKIVGADGEVTRSATNNMSGEMMFSLMQTSSSNNILNTLLKLAETVAVGDVFPIYIKNLNANEVFIAEQCWIGRKPDFGGGRAARTREWRCDVAKASITYGGAVR